MLPVFPLLYNRSMYHVPSVPNVTHGADGTCGTVAPSGTWYAGVILIKLAFAFVAFCESNAKILLAAELSEVFALSEGRRQWCLIYSFG